MSLQTESPNSKSVGQHARMTPRVKLVAGNSHPAFAREISDCLGIPLSETLFKRFGNENLMFQCLENVREQDVFVIQTSTPPLSDHIIELLIMIDALRHASASRITVVLPYFPYARSDKKDRPRISITARLMADLLETAGAHRVLTMNLHSPQVQGFFRIPVDQLNATPMLCDYLRESTALHDHVLVASDVGEAKDLQSYAERLGLPVAIVDKRRDDDSERPRAVALIGQVKGRNALIIDDEVASGGTLEEAANFLMSQGAARVEAAAVHPVLSGSALARLTESPIERLVVTNSIPVPDSPDFPIHQVSVAPLFAKAIEAIHSGSSISALFH